MKVVAEANSGFAEVSRKISRKHAHGPQHGPRADVKRSSGVMLASGQCLLLCVIGSDEADNKLSLLALREAAEEN